MNLFQCDAVVETEMMVDFLATPTESRKETIFIGGGCFHGDATSLSSGYGTASIMNRLIPQVSWTSI